MGGGAREGHPENEEGHKDSLRRHPPAEIYPGRRISAWRKPSQSWPFSRILFLFFKLGLARIRTQSRATFTPYSRNCVCLFVGVCFWITEPARRQSHWQVSVRSDDLVELGKVMASRGLLSPAGRRRERTQMSTSCLEQCFCKAGRVFVGAGWGWGPQEESRPFCRASKTPLRLA